MLHGEPAILTVPHIRVNTEPELLEVEREGFVLKDLRGTASRRHRGLVRPERAARRRRLGPANS
jgi:hypothetical protein